MMRTFVPKPPGKMTPRKLDQMRRQMVITFYQDLKLFGYRTESVVYLQRKIVKAKQELK